MHDERGNKGGERGRAEPSLPPKFHRTFSRENPESPLTGGKR